MHSKLLSVKGSTPLGFDSVGAGSASLMLASSCIFCKISTAFWKVICPKVGIEVQKKLFYHF